MIFLWSKKQHYQFYTRSWAWTPILIASKLVIFIYYINQGWPTKLWQWFSFLQSSLQLLAFVCYRILLSLFLVNIWSFVLVLRILLLIVTIKKKMSKRKSENNGKWLKRNREENCIIAFIKAFSLMWRQLDVQNVTG